MKFILRFENRGEPSQSSFRIPTTTFFLSLGRWWLSMTIEAGATRKYASLCQLRLRWHGVQTRIPQ